MAVVVCVVQPTDAQSPQSADAQQQNAQAAASTKTEANDASQQAPLTLAEAARLAREKRKHAAKASVVYTNDNLPTQGGISIVGPAATAAEQEGENSPTVGSSSSVAGAPKTEAWWRAQFGELRTKLRQNESELEIMQRQLGELNVQYYSNPAQALQQDYTRSDINNQTAAISAKKQDITNIQQQISDLEDQLRQSGGDPGWARE